MHGDYSDLIAKELERIGDLLPGDVGTDNIADAIDNNTKMLGVIARLILNQCVKNSIELDIDGDPITDEILVIHNILELVDGDK